MFDDLNQDNAKADGNTVDSNNKEGNRPVPPPIPGATLGGVDNLKESNFSEKNTPPGGVGREAGSAPQVQARPAEKKFVPPQAPAPAPSEPEDIFAATEPDKPAAFQPMAEGGKEDRKDRQPTGGGTLKKLIVPILIVIAVAIFIVGGAYAYKYIIGDVLLGDPGPEREAIENREIPANMTKEIEKEAAEPAATEPENMETVPPPPPIDTDRDGLSDEEEDALGTSKTLVDSDGDGLFDREEVMVYKTDPLNRDTDADGFTDGDEVKNGYNPAGNGKLYEL